MNASDLEELIKSELAVLAVTDGEVAEVIREAAKGAETLEQVRAIIREAAISHKAELAEKIELRALSF